MAGVIRELPLRRLLEVVYMIKQVFPHLHYAHKKLHNYFSETYKSPL